MHYSDSKSPFQDHLKWHSLSSIRANTSPIRTIFHLITNSMLSHLLCHRHLIFSHILSKSSVFMLKCKVNLASVKVKS